MRVHMAKDSRDIKELRVYHNTAHNYDNIKPQLTMTVCLHLIVLSQDIL